MLREGSQPTIDLRIHVTIDTWITKPSYPRKRVAHMEVILCCLALMFFYFKFVFLVLSLDNIVLGPSKIGEKDERKKRKAEKKQTKQNSIPNIKNRIKDGVTGH